MTREHPRWQFDWAGPHGTVWGSVNGCLTTISITSAAHVWADVGPIVAVIATIAAVVGVLTRAALRKARTPGATVLYQVMCWAGAGGWSAWMLANPTWTWQWWAQWVGVLAAATIAAGILAALASEVRRSHEQQAQLGDAPPDSNRSRVAIAEAWEARIGRVCKFEARIEGVDRWDNGHGYTLEGQMPEGGVGLDDLRNAASRLATDANLPHGCKVTPKSVPGGTKRQFLLDVETANGLAGEEFYPDEITPLTINGPIPIGRKPSFEAEMVYLRERNLIAVGETGSGKTNTQHDLTAGFVRCRDAITMQVDLTGAGLSLPWLQPWLDGKAARPAIGAVADTPKKAMQMCRALLRIGYTRKQAYQKLMADHDDDKLPIGAKVDDSHIVPQIILQVDEIAGITGSRTKWPDMRDLILQIMNELRASGIRVVLAGLRATDDVVISAVQSMCHTRIGLRVAEKSELSYLFSWKQGLDPEDIPDPGMGFIQHNGADKPTPFRSYRIKPSMIGAIAMAAGDKDRGWIPELDPISRAAANGRNLDGTPIPGVPHEDLDWYEKRWDGWQDRVTASPVQTAVPAEPQIPPIPPPPPVTASLDEITAEAKRADEELAARIDDAKQEQAAREREVFAAIVAAENWDAPATTSETPEPTPESGDQQRMLKILMAAGPDGIGPKELRGQLAADGVEISRDTLHTWLRLAESAKQVHQPKYGKWAYGSGPRRTEQNDEPT